MTSILIVEDDNDINNLICNNPEGRGISMRKSV